jgi:signal transduction histidine kinase
MPARKPEQLRKELTSTLRSDELDYDRVLELASELARHDPHHVRFTVDAGHISRLGRELVARAETAVSELIKNSYDADATTVQLTFEESDSPGGILTIDDDGHGMTREQLIDGFMRISSTEKVHNPFSPKYHRTRAGRKGIGRFAAQRLGSGLTVVTQAKGSKHALRLDVDWEEFEQDRELIRVTSRINQQPKTREHGTTLVITGLREAWDEPAIRRVYRFVMDLLQPYPIRPIKGKPSRDPGFQVTIERVVQGSRVAVGSVEQMVYDFALARIDARVDSKGRGSWTVTSERFSIADRAKAIGRSPNRPKDPFLSLRNVHLTAYYFIYTTEFIPRNQRKALLDLASERGGIRVYRNGFRVLPYGEPLNDWLELDASSAGRRLLPPHANINFFGFADLRDTHGSVFEETASREGLLHNQAFDELVDFAYRVLVASAGRIAEARGRKVKPNQKDWSPTDRLKQTAEEIESIADDLESTGEESGANAGGAGRTTGATRGAAEQLRLLKRRIENDAAETEDVTQALLEENAMLRVLASLGLTIGEFTHEIKHRVPAVRAYATTLLAVQRDLKGKRLAEKMVDSTHMLEAYTSYFDRTVAQNVRRETAPLDLVAVVGHFVEDIGPAIEESGIELDGPYVIGDELVTRPMHPSEWASILFNLYTNAVKAIDRAEVDGKLRLQLGRTSESVFLDFADNGEGVPSENAERIFDAFFTTSTPAGPFSEGKDMPLGTGLGLKILRDIVSAYGGTVRLVESPPGYRTCFRVEVPVFSEGEEE